MQHYNTLLETAAPGKGFDPLPLLLIFVVFFFFIIWPQMRKQKKAKAYLAEIKKGDYIVTTGGIHGKISSIGDTYLVVEMEEGKAKIENYETANGEKRNRTEITADYVGASIEYDPVKIIKVDRPQEGRKAFQKAKASIEDPWSAPDEIGF